MTVRKPAFAVVAATMILAASAAAKEAWTVEGKLLGKRDTDGPGIEKSFEKSTDVSGIACAEAGGYPRVCVIADDEAQGVQIARVEDGRVVVGPAIRLIYDTLEGKPLELDAEGVAFADGAFYVIGSHGRPRHGRDGSRRKGDAKAAASRHLFRLRFDPAAVAADGSLAGAVEIRDSTALPRLLRAQAEIAPAFDAAVEDGGLTIEGVAVSGDRLYAGLRAPVLEDGHAAVLSAPLGTLFDGRDGASHLHRLDLGRDPRKKPRGVRDLVAYGDKFLVIAGPMLDPDPPAVEDGDYTVYVWDGREGTRSLGDLAAYGEKVKPEALLPLSVAGNRLRVLVLYDGPEEGAPRIVDLARP